MLKRHTTPCLDAKDGRVVKGVNFVNLTDVGDPADAAHAYYEIGYDELVLLDITAVHEECDTTVEMVKCVAGQVFTPFTVGDGVRSVEGMNKILKVGVDKIAINSSAIASPQFIKDCAEKSGNQCVVSAIDTREEADDTWHVYVIGGHKNIGIDLIEWAKTVVNLGVGEILLTGMDKDGTKSGFDLDMSDAVADAVSIPIIASGSVGSTDHMVDVFGKTTVTSALAAPILHSGKVSTIDTKAVMVTAGIEVRQ